MISNICRANFNGGRTAQGNNRFQWDYGQILEISGIENLPDPFTAQFSNTPVLGTAKTAVGTGGRVEIPNEYFVSGQNIYCFIVLHTDEDDGRTVYIATIPVTKRPKPIDDPITPTQQSTIDTAIAALQAGVAKAEGFAGDAEEQAGIAQNAATTATEAATRAEGAVADVEAAATRAETAAEGAEASATDAEASATDAESAKTAAEAAKDAAETAAANAEQSATDAGNYAGLAEAAEIAAATSATAAEASASAAATSATQAHGSATQAAQKASEAASSSTAAQTSATNAEAAKTGAEAAQEAAETAQGKAEEAAGNAEQSATTAEWYAERVERFLPTDTASGEIASFPDGADGVPMQSVVVSMEPVQDLHGYDNPWPAGGGKNLLPFNAPVRETTINGVAWKINDDGSVSVSGTATAASTMRYAIDTEQRFNGNYKFYAFSGNISKSDFQGGVKIGAKWFSVYANGTKQNLTDADGILSETWFQVIEGKTVNATFYPMIYSAEESDPTAWTPYENICPISGRTGATVKHSGADVSDPTILPVTFPASAGTVYGGTLDVVTGELVVDMAMVDMGSLYWAYLSGANPYFSAAVTGINANPYTSANLYCSMYPTTPLPLGEFTLGIRYSGAASVMVKDPGYSDATEFKTAMQGVQLVYELADPIAYHLAPQEVRTLLGTNNVWSDAGETEVTYKADVQLYIDKRISALS